MGFFTVPPAKRSNAMGKLDKKVLKILKTRQFEDLDAEDIAMQFKGNEDEVKESLDSLKGMGLVESIVKDGKTLWHLSVDEPPEKPGNPELLAEPEPIDSDTVSFDVSSLKARSEPAKEQEPKKETPETTIDFFSVSDPVVSAAPKPGTIEPIKAKTETPKVAQEPRQPEPVQAPKVPAAPAAKEPSLEKVNIHKDYIHDDDEDDTDIPVRSVRKASPFPIIGIAVAVVFSAVISAVIAMMFATDAKKEVSGGLGELEKKVTEANAKQDRRIESIIQKVNTISDKPPSPQVKPASPGHSVKPSAPKPPPKQPPKRGHSPKKKKGKSSPPSENATPPPDESSSAAPSSPASSSTTESSPPPETPAAEQPAAPSSNEGSSAAPAAEGSGQ
jgi:hypothetical protein